MLVRVKNATAAWKRTAIARRQARHAARYIRNGPLADYITNGFPYIEGWCGGPVTFILLEILKEAQPESCHSLGAAEIGVHHGLFMIGMHLLCGSKAKSLGLDLFELQHFNVDQSGLGNRETFLRNVRAFVGDHGICNASEPTDSLAITDHDIGRIREAYTAFRFFSIDGGHTANHCVNDLKIAEALTAHGGVIVLDDTFSHQWPGVTEGMYRYLASPKRAFRPFASTAKKTFFAEEHFCVAYTAALTRGLERRRAPHWRKTTEIAGSHVQSFEMHA